MAAAISMEIAGFSHRYYIYMYGLAEGAAHGFRGKTQGQSDDEASLISLLTIYCVYIYATYIERVPSPAGHHAASCETFISKGC